MFATACLIYRGVGPTPDYRGEWLPAQIVSGSTIGFALVALTTATVDDLPPNRVATGTAVANCVRQLGGCSGSLV